MNQTKAIEIKDMSFSYERIPVLEDVDIVIEKGEFISMVGPNGGGKTTLCKLILGLLKPNQGTIKVLGLKPEEARPKVGYVPQTTFFDRQFPIKVLDVVLMSRLGGSLKLGSYSKRDKELAMEALKEVEMEDYSHRLFASLSGGQRQRVLFARALAIEPELLLLDEPTSNIDMIAQKELYDLLKGFNERMTVILVTHDIGFVSNLVKRVVCVNRKVFIHPTDQLTGEMMCQLYGQDLSIILHDKHLKKED